MGSVNLIPPARIARRKRKAKIHLWMVICGTYLISLTVLALSTHAFWRDTDDSTIEELAFTTQRIEGYNSKISELQKILTQAKSELEAGRVISCQPDWTKLLILVGDELKEEIVLGNCQLVTGSRSSGNMTNTLQDLPSSSSPQKYLAERQYKLELNGYGRTQTSVSQFVLRLEQMGMFDAVELINSRRQTFLNHEAVTFRIESSI
ncbi:PilN domain-containing protein [Planctomycetota bacterium]